MGLSRGFPLCGDGRRGDGHMTPGRARRGRLLQTTAAAVGWDVA